MTINAKRSAVYAWVVRIAAILFGAIAAFSGIYGYFHGNVTYTQYDARIGTTESGNALWFGIFGIFMMAVGLFLPRKSSK